jgi:hypothetical protein
VNYFANLHAGLSRPVPVSDDFRRINALPVRSVAEPQPGWEDRFRLRGCDDPSCGYHGPLFPFQRTFLWEVSLAKGGVASAGIGAGKTLVSLLCATVLGVERVVIVVPPALRSQTARAYEHLKEHWSLVEPTIVAYSDLSNPRKDGVIEAARPQLVVYDEAHCVASWRSVRGKRVRKALRATNPMVVLMSGTLTNRSHRDYAPLFGWALRDKSPCPLKYRAMESFSYALDDFPPHLGNAPPGPLTAWLRPDDPPGVEGVRTAYRRRMADTQGVVFTKAMSCDASIVIDASRPRLPKAVKAALSSLRSVWALPDGTEFDSALDYQRHLETMAQGFWQRWTEPAPAPWLEARKAWTAELRAYLGRGRSGAIDSPFRYEQAVAEGRLPSTSFARWAAIRDSFKPRTETVWLDEFLVDSAASWAKNQGGIVWSRSPDWGRLVAERAGCLYYGDGEDDAEALMDLAEGPEAGKEPLVLSLSSHYQGRNLQRWVSMYFPYPDALARVTEQAIGRIHRTGQKADEVSVTFALTVSEAEETLARAVRNARYGGTTFDQEQRLLRARWLFDLPAPTASHVPSAVDIQPNDC